MDAVRAGNHIINLGTVTHITRFADRVEVYVVGGMRVTVLDNDATEFMALFEHVRTGQQIVDAAKLAEMIEQEATNA